MKRTLVVLALAVLSSAGCRALNMQRSDCGDACGVACGDGCGAECGAACGDGCGEPCHMRTARNAPRPMMAHSMRGGGRGGNLEQAYPGGQGCCFDRYCGSECGPGYHPGPYDCSPCNSPHWGNSGYRHPHGYVDNHSCRMCQCQGQIPGHCAGVPHCSKCGGYCGCGQPAPGCPLCCCGPSGDHNYQFNPGPPVAQTAYPYYTLRGPRDFLLDNPPSIGPY